MESRGELLGSLRLWGKLNDIWTLIRENHIVWHQDTCVAPYQPRDLDDPLDSSASELSSVHTSCLWNEELYWLDKVIAKIMSEKLVWNDSLLKLEAFYSVCDRSCPEPLEEPQIHFWCGPHPSPWWGIYLWKFLFVLIELFSQSQLRP